MTVLALCFLAFVIGVPTVVFAIAFKLFASALRDNRRNPRQTITRRGWGE